MPELIAFYGTLRRGERADRLGREGKSPGLSFAGFDHLPGRLVDVAGGHCPGLVEDPSGGWVEAELWRIDDPEVLATLDRHETETGPPEARAFERVVLRTRGGHEVFAYRFLG